MATNDLNTQGIREGALRAKQSNAAQLLNGYKFEEKMILTHRIAHYLDWLAKTQPGMVPSYPLIVRAEIGRAHV